MEPTINTHRCNASLRCKSKDCCHAKHHVPNGHCDRSNAPCGCWPGDVQFKPMVKCVPANWVKPRGDCRDCGAKEAAGHHPADCIAVLRQKLTRYDALAEQVRDLREAITKALDCATIGEAENLLNRACGRSRDPGKEE